MTARSRAGARAIWQPLAGCPDAAVAASLALLVAASLALGASVALVSLLLSAASVLLVLGVLRGERRRNVLLHGMLERISREAGVVTSGQDR